MHTACVCVVLIAVGEETSEQNQLVWPCPVRYRSQWKDSRCYLSQSSSCFLSVCILLELLWVLFLRQYLLMTAAASVPVFSIFIQTAFISLYNLFPGFSHGCLMQEALAHCSMANRSSVALHVKVERGGPFGEGEGLSSSEVRVLLSAAWLSGDVRGVALQGELGAWAFYTKICLGSSL